MVLAPSPKLAAATPEKAKVKTESKLPNMRRTCEQNNLYPYTLSRRIISMDDVGRSMMLPGNVKPLENRTSDI